MAIGPCAFTSTSVFTALATVPEDGGGLSCFFCHLHVEVSSASGQVSFVILAAGL